MRDIATNPVFADAPHLPIRERLLDRLSDILLASDDILDLIASNPISPSDATRAVEEQIRGVYERVNELMKSMSD